ncbi:unnamed protein product [Rotaria sp. Silwood2]|nr:unnamed protein product [Rotaria sp. Silwood2]CAF2769006.1 unnamed protein product [Rotaria sp. Silwood2]CAF4015740.1 unnamed protein product [Rotaria sp. Silwood2]CAF4283473.1 unnamed protein product [Rotaria sp. Silwood2]
MTSNKQLLRHVVLFKFNENTSSADITRLENEFRTLATVKVSQVKEYEWGANVSKENLDRGYTHCFILTFANEQDRDIYLYHEDHVAFVNIIKPYLAEVTVVDFWANN